VAEPPGVATVTTRGSYQGGVTPFTRFFYYLREEKVGKKVGRKRGRMGVEEKVEVL
jgi:hypothetical protein